MRSSSLVMFFFLISFLFPNFNVLFLKKSSANTMDKPVVENSFRDTLFEYLSEIFFKKLDTDNSNSLSETEYIEGMKKFLKKQELEIPTDDNLRETFNEIKGTRKIQISYTEWKIWLKNQLIFSNNISILRLLCIYGFKNLGADDKGLLNEETFIEKIIPMANKYGFPRPSPISIRDVIRYFEPIFKTKIVINEFISLTDYVFHYNPFNKEIKYISPSEKFALLLFDLITENYFKQLDSNNSSTISLEEYITNNEKLYSTFNLNPHSKRHLVGFFREIDKKNKGEINLNDLREWCRYQIFQRKNNGLLTLLSVITLNEFDTSKTRRLSRDDFVKSIVKYADESKFFGLDNIGINNTFTEFVQNDGKIGLEEFTKILKQKFQL